MQKTEACRRMILAIKKERGNDCSRNTYAFLSCLNRDDFSSTSSNYFHSLSTIQNIRVLALKTRVFKEILSCFFLNLQSTIFTQKCPKKGVCNKLYHIRLNSQMEVRMKVRFYQIQPNLYYLLEIYCKYAILSKFSQIFLQFCPNLFFHKIFPWKSFSTFFTLKTRSGHLDRTLAYKASYLRPFLAKIS